MVTTRSGKKAEAQKSKKTTAPKKATASKKASVSKKAASPKRNIIEKEPRSPVKKSKKPSSPVKRDEVVGGPIQRYDYKSDPPLFSFKSPEMSNIKSPKMPKYTPVSPFKYTPVSPPNYSSSFGPSGPDYKNFSFKDTAVGAPARQPPLFSSAPNGSLFSQSLFPSTLSRKEFGKIKKDRQRKGRGIHFSNKSFTEPGDRNGFNSMMSSLMNQISAVKRRAEVLEIRVGYKGYKGKVENTMWKELRNSLTDAAAEVERIARMYDMWST